MVDKITNPPSQKDLIDKVNELVDGKADIDLSNITSAGKNIANWSTNVTNCITEISQDIKLELNNGTLTLKAGSKVYVPNGAGVFDEVIIESDKTVETYGITGSVFVFARQDGSVIYGNQLVSTVNSGTTPGSGLYYKTDTNEINTYNSGVLQDGKFSLPIAICTVNSGTVTSIDQVFNGFGYIGKRNFITNVKLRIAKGYNTDGTYHNQEYIINSPIVARNDFGNNSIMFFRNNNGSYQIYNIGEQNYLGELDYVPDIGGVFQWYYNTTNRMWYMHEANEQSWRQVDYANLGINTSTETNFKEVFRAVDYNDVVLKQDLARVATSGSYSDLSNKPDLSTKANIDLSNINTAGKSFVSGLGMPSNRYIDLTIGAHGSSYTAPANGWFNFRGHGISVEIYRGHMHVCCMYPQPEWGAVNMPVQKGQTITILYNLTGERNLRFYYSQGSESEAN